MEKDMTDFTTSIVVDKSPQKVFTAVTNPRGWWSESIVGGTEKLGDEFMYEVKDIHYSTQRLTEVIPDKKVVWLVTASNMTFLKQKDEWTGTHVVFEITPEDGKTKLTFTHQGLVPQVECYQACMPAWTQYIQHSLKQLIETGVGDPNLEDRTIAKPVGT